MSVKNAAVCRLVCTEREPEREREQETEAQKVKERKVCAICGLACVFLSAAVLSRMIDRQAGHVVVLVRCAFPTFKLASIALEIRAITSTQLNETG